MDEHEIIPIIKKYSIFILAAGIIALAVWWLWVRKASPSVPPAGSGARVMSEQEVQDALRSLTAPPQKGPARVDQKILDSLTVPAR